MAWILASASPRRQELLRVIMKDFEVIPTHVDEDIHENWPIEVIAENLAQIKGEALASQDSHSHDFIISADTVVRTQAEVLGKPSSPEDAISMLTLLSNQVHIVETGVCIFEGSQLIHKFTEQTQVEFKDLNEHEIQDYINSNEPFGKAGAYAIQGLGALFVKKINGCYNNVVGLPIFKLNEIIHRQNYERNKQSNALG